MDNIQKFLVKKGRSDLAQEYYEKLSAKIPEKYLEEEKERAKKWYNSLDSHDKNIIDMVTGDLHNKRKSQYPNNDTSEILAIVMYHFGGSREFSIIEALINL